MGNNLYATTISARSFRTTSTYNLRWPKGRHLSFLQQKINMLGPKFFPCYSLPTFPLTSSLSCSSHCLQEPSIHLHTKLPPSPPQLLPPHFPLAEILFTCTSLYFVDLCEAPTQRVSCILFGDPIEPCSCICTATVALDSKLWCASGLLLHIGFSGTKLCFIHLWVVHDWHGMAEVVAQ